LRFDFRERCPSGSESEFVDIDSFLDAAPEVRKQIIPDAATEPPTAATETAVSQPAGPREEASPEFIKDLELTIHKGENPIPDVPLIEVHESLPEG
jgi:hypothetical protein